MIANVDVQTHLRSEVMVGGVSNAVFNGLLAWLTLRNGPDLLWTGAQSFAIDVLATSFLLPLIVALIVMSIQRRKMLKGELQSMKLEEGSMMQSLADRFPYGIFKSAILFGFAGLLLVAPITLAGIYLAGITSFTPVTYAVFKGVWAGAMAAVFVIAMVLVALRDCGPVQKT